MPLKVISRPIGKKLHQLEIYVNGQRIGEYERSQAEDIACKTAEVKACLPLLQEIRQKHGELVVRWNNRRREKVIYVNGSEVGTVPRTHWRTPSWET